MRQILRAGDASLQVKGDGEHPLFGCWVFECLLDRVVEFFPGFDYADAHFIAVGLAQNLINRTVFAESPICLD